MAGAGSCNTVGPRYCRMVQETGFGLCQTLGACCVFWLKWAKETGPKMLYQCGHTCVVFCEICNGWREEIKRRETKHPFSVHNIKKTQERFIVVGPWLLTFHLQMVCKENPLALPTQIHSAGILHWSVLLCSPLVPEWHFPVQICRLEASKTPEIRIGCNNDAHIFKHLFLTDFRYHVHLVRSCWVLSGGRFSWKEWKECLNLVHLGSPPRTSQENAKNWNTKDVIFGQVFFLAHVPGEIFFPQSAWVIRVGLRCPHDTQRYVLNSICFAIKELFRMHSRYMCRWAIYWSQSWNTTDSELPLYAGNQLTYQNQVLSLREHFGTVPDVRADETFLMKLSDYVSIHAASAFLQNEWDGAF